MKINNNYIRVSKKKCKPAKDRALKLLNDLQRDPVLSSKYVFSYRLVGSGKWGTMVKDKNGCYDLDYQILLTGNSSEYKRNKLSNATQIKNDFIAVFSRYLNKSEKIENSTTAITLISKSTMHYHIDFVIIKLFPNNNMIIRRNIKKETFYKNEFTWNELPKLNEAYTNFNKLLPLEKMELIEKYIIPAKYIEKMKDEGDKTKLSSAQVFVLEVNKYVDKKRNNRL